MKAVLILQALLVCVECYKLPMVSVSVNVVTNPTNDKAAEAMPISKQKTLETAVDSQPLSPGIPGGLMEKAIAVPLNSKNLRAAGPQSGFKIL